jgi:pseudaminic acid cytidylyltransferase
MNLCIIPARGGSKRVPRKNIKRLNGIPLLAYSILIAQESGLFDEILVTSEDAEILSIATEYGASIHSRGAELSGDNIPVFKVFESILRQKEYEQYDQFVAMLPTCPFKTSIQLKEALALLKDSPDDTSIISVVKFDYPPQFGFSMGEKGDLKMTHPEVFGKTTRSQNMEPLYHNNGAFWITRTQNYLNQGGFYKGNLVPYEMDPISSFDIDYPWQFELAEVIADKKLYTTET